MRAGSRQDRARKPRETLISVQTSAGVAVPPPQRWSIVVAGATAMEHRCGSLLRPDPQAGLRSRDWRAWLGGREPRGTRCVAPSGRPPRPPRPRSTGQPLDRHALATADIMSIISYTYW